MMTASSDEDWCTVTLAGRGNDTLFANFTQNPLQVSRIANITVAASGASTVVVRLFQEFANAINRVAGSAMKVDPNPAGSVLTVGPASPDDPIIGIEITGMEGRELIVAPLNPGPIKQIDTSSLPEGLYLLMITNVKERFTTRVLIRTGQQ